MRVLIITNNDVGLYKFRKELVSKLLEKNEVFIALPNGNYINQFKDMGCHFIETEFDRHEKNPLKELKLIRLYKKILRTTKPNIVFTYTIKPNAYAGMICASLRIPYVVNVTGLGIAIENGGLIQKISLLLYKHGLKKAQKVFFQNAENMKFMVNHKVIKSLYDLLPGSGVNLENYRVTEYPNGRNVNFVFVSRIMREKGIDQYLDAAKIIRKKHPETRFHVCGFCEQAYENELNRLSDSKIIIYHGLVDDMASIYKKMNCTVHPTYYPEGLSNVLLESAASGRPIITTNRSGCREVVDDGVNGYIVKERDSDDLVEKIEKFLSLSYEEKKQMGLAGRTKVEKEFDRQIVIDKYLKELFQVNTNGL
jgi:glycosyltransferase involved in cell wall biosynthesis